MLVDVLLKSKGSGVCYSSHLGRGSPAQEEARSFRHEEDGQGSLGRGLRGEG